MKKTLPERGQGDFILIAIVISPEDMKFSMFSTAFFWLAFGLGRRRRNVTCKFLQTLKKSKRKSAICFQNLVYHKTTKNYDRQEKHK